MADPLKQSLEPVLPTGVVVDERTLGGVPVVAGTRVPAETIAAYLRDGHTAAEIRADYPSLPADGIRAVEVWAAHTYGPAWKARSRPVPSRA